MAPAKKAAAKKPAKKAAAKQEPDVETQPPPPPMEGEEYEQGFLGVTQDDEDHSVAAQVAKLNEE